LQLQDHQRLQIQVGLRFTDGLVAVA